MSRPLSLRLLPASLLLALFPALPACQQTKFKISALPKFSFPKSFGKKKDAPDPTAAATAAAAPAAPDTPAAASPEETAFLEKCAALSAGSGPIAGKDGYHFSPVELQRLSQLRDPASPSLKAASAALLDYRNSLKRLGIDLIFVPLPPKAIVFADKLSPDLKIKVRGKKPARLDSALQSFYANLTSQGLTVIDPTNALLSGREDRKAGPVFPKSAAVWSPRAAATTADLIASRIKSGKWPKTDPKAAPLIAEAATLTFSGSLSTGPATPETLALRNIGRAADGKMRSVTFSSGGHPLTLMGDSSLLAWREANNPNGSSGAFASLADQLAFELQTTPDVFPGQTDGRNAPRLRLLRDMSNGRNPLSDTKTLVWVVPATDLALTDWKRVPLTLGNPSPRSSAAPATPVFQAPPIGLIPDPSAPAPAVSPPPAPIAPVAPPDGEPALPR